MSILLMIWNIVNFLMDLSVVVWLSCFFLFGGKWYVGSFASIRIYGILFKSKHKYRDFVE